MYSSVHTFMVEGGSVISIILTHSFILLTVQCLVVRLRGRIRKGINTLKCFYKPKSSDSFCFLKPIRQIRAWNDTLRSLTPSTSEPRKPNRIKMRLPNQSVFWKRSKPPFFFKGTVIPNLIRGERNYSVMEFSKTKKFLFGTAVSAFIQISWQMKALDKPRLYLEQGPRRSGYSWQ